jgi:TolB-like protein
MHKLNKIGMYPRLQFLSYLRESFLGFRYSFIFIFAAWLILTCLTSCVQKTLPAASMPGEIAFTLPDPQPYSNLLESSYAAADSLGRGLRFRGVSLDESILAASFVNIDDLTKSSTLGRIVSEQIASRLAQHGFKIIEVKLRQESVFIKEGKGEFLLSREVLSLGATRGAHAVLVGTYAVSRNFIFVSARVVRTEDNSVVTGYDYELPNDATTKSMLR